MLVNNCNFWKRWISNLVRTTRSWNNLHQVRSQSKDWKPNKFREQ